MGYGLRRGGLERQRIVYAVRSLIDREPSRQLRALFRAPVPLYRWGLGWVFGKRLLMLAHIGRCSGQERSTVLEVVAHEKNPEVWYVAAAWGDRSDWFRNLRHNQCAEIRVGRQRHRVVANVVDLERAMRVHRTYVREHPWAARLLGRMLGIDLADSDPRILAERIPLVALTVDEAPATPGDGKVRTSTRSETQSTYDRIARFYEAIEGFWERPARTAGLAALKASPGEHVFEIGCGPGYTLSELAESVGTEGRAIGIDLSSKMCRLARRRLDRQGATGIGAVVQADAVRLPFDGGFDAGFISFTLELFDSSEIPIVLAECRRMLQPGGRLVVVALEKQHPAPVMQRAYLWGHERFPRLLDCRPIRLESWLRDAGFVIAEVTELSLWGLPVAIAVGTDRPSLVATPPRP